MSDNPLRDLLNDRRWNHGDLDRVWLDTVHRGAPRFMYAVDTHRPRCPGNLKIISQSDFGGSRKLNFAALLFLAWFLCWYCIIL